MHANRLRKSAWQTKENSVNSAFGEGTRRCFSFVNSNGLTQTGRRRSTLNPDGGWTISTSSVSLPTILGGRDRDDVWQPILDKELHTGFHTKTTQVLATSLSIVQSHVRTCWNHCQINNTQSRTRRNHKI